MGQEICGYCGGSGRDAINPSQSSCWKCGGMGGYWVQDTIKSHLPNPPRPSGGQYRLLRPMQRVLDSLPRWLNVIVAVVGGALGIALGQAIYPSTDTATWAFGAGGLSAGFIVLPLIVVLIDFVMRLTIVLVKLAIAAAIIGGVTYAILQFVGNR